MNSEPLAAGSANGAPTVEVKVLDPRVHRWGLPRYQSAMAAAVDLFASISEPLALEPQGPAQLIPSGISVHIGDPQIVGLIVPRSGLGHGKGLVLGNLVGILDADYTGPLMISAWNRSGLGTEAIVINPGDRIAQLIFLPVVRPEFRMVTEFSKETERGSGGFGSTGQASTV
ncbi:MAG: dUTP diphosphatase [Candidatus Lustribacter sp.]